MVRFCSKHCDILAKILSQERRPMFIEGVQGRNAKGFSFNPEMQKVKLACTSQHCWKLMVYISQMESNTKHLFTVGVHDEVMYCHVMYGNETWCLRENELAILRRTKKNMIRAMCGAKIEKRSQELISLLGLTDTLDGLAKVSGV